MLINNVHIMGRKENPSQIEITGSKINSVGNNIEHDLSVQNKNVINFTNAIAFPGLINSHDHLEFNFFPRLGNKIYNDYIDWGNDIHALNKKQIEEVKKVPYDLRFRWGLYKNLICGVTSIGHHGKDPVCNYENLPDVITRYNYLHSIRLEPHWKMKLNLLFNGYPFVIHIGEGKNKESQNEIEELIKCNLFNKKIVGVHGISLNESQSRKLKAVVWCPDSNLFLYNISANIDSLKNHTRILFGTDSTLSADWNLWNHLRLARKINHLSQKELFSSLTTVAAEAWNINSFGAILAKKTADIVVSKRKHEDDWESFFQTNPEEILLILKKGKIIFIDKSLAEKQFVPSQSEYDLISIGSSAKYITKGIKELVQSVKQYLPEYEFPFVIM